MSKSIGVRKIISANDFVHCSLTYLYNFTAEQYQCSYITVVMLVWSIYFVRVHYFAIIVGELAFSAFHATTL